VFEPSRQMALDHPELVQAAVGLDARPPPETLIDAEDDVATDEILVSCSVEARLRSGPGVFELDEPEWVERNFTTADAAVWSWFVTPNRLGEHRLTLQLRPVLRIGDESDRFLTGASILERSISVTVADPDLWERLIRWLENATEVLRGLEGALLALAAVLAAGAAVKTGLWWRERHGRDRARRPEGDEAEPSRR
jgi:hypothetical protein